MENSQGKTLMTIMQIVVVGLVVLITHAIEAITGFGCTVLALPFVTAILGVKLGVPLLAVLGWILALYMVVTKWKQIIFREFFIIVFFVGIGMPIGMYAFQSLDPTILKKGLAFFIILTSIWRIIKGASKKKDNEESECCTAAPTKRLPKWIAYPTLIVGGIIHGAFASGGPLVVLYAAMALPNKGNFRATLCLLWTSLNTILIINYFRLGIFVTDFNIGLAIMFPFILTGIIIGEKIHDRVHPVHFEQIIFSVLGLTGIVMLFL
jgi:uncharacterized protein